MLIGFLLSLALATVADSQKITSLSGKKWTLQNEQGNIIIPGSLPSQAHLDLLAAGKIGDPYFGTGFTSINTES
jgi:beta-mannosidase